VLPLEGGIGTRAILRDVFAPFGSLISAIINVKISLQYIIYTCARDKFLGRGGRKLLHVEVMYRINVSLSMYNTRVHPGLDVKPNSQAKGTPRRLV